MSSPSAIRQRSDRDPHADRMCSRRLVGASWIFVVPLNLLCVTSAGLVIATARVAHVMKENKVQFAACRGRLQVSRTVSTTSVGPIRLAHHRFASFATSRPFNAVLSDTFKSRRMQTQRIRISMLRKKKNETLFLLSSLNPSLRFTTSAIKRRQQITG